MVVDASSEGHIVTAEALSGRDDGHKWRALSEHNCHPSKRGRMSVSASFDGLSQIAVRLFCSSTRHNSRGLLLMHGARRFDAFMYVL